MLSLKKFPWFSLSLLLITYITLGWLLTASRDPWYAWVIVGVGVVLLNVLLSSPWSQIRRSLSRLLQSDTKVFLASVIAAFLSAIIVTWLHVSLHALLVIASGTLFKLDVQTAKLSASQTFWILCVVSLIGLCLGRATQFLLYLRV